MLCLEQGKQNLWEGTDGHCTKWVSSRRSWQRVQHRGALAAREESGRLAGCTGSSPPVPPAPWPPTSLGPSLLWFIEDGEGGLLLFLRVVECTGLASLEAWLPPALSATRIRAAMGDWPFWAASGGVVVRLEWGEAVGGGGDTNEGVAFRGILSPSVDVDSHGWASPLIFGGPTSPSGSGEVFLFRAVLATENHKQIEKKKGGGGRREK